jgi:membrane associated rhomboid family serine protease
VIPLTVDVPMKRIPWANWGLILATVILSLVVPYARVEPVQVHFSEDGRPQIPFPTEKYSPLVLQRDHFAVYQLVTALFQHAGFIHLFGNMLFLFVFGNPINAKLGHLGFLGCYLAIGVLVDLVWLVIGPGSACLGASGAIMGMCGMFLVLYPRNDVKVFWNEWQFALVSNSWTGEIPGWAIVLIFLGFDVWGALVDRNSGIGYLSHVVGGVTGVVLAVAVLKTRWLTPDRGEQTLLQWLAGEGPTEEDVSPKQRKLKAVRSFRIGRKRG